MRLEKEVLGERTFSPNPTAHSVVGKEQRCIHKSDDPNMTGWYVCSMPLGSLIVALVPCAATVKGMGLPPKNLAG
jgi:hypothetical protein